MPIIPEMQTNTYVIYHLFHMRKKNVDNTKCWSECWDLVAVLFAQWVWSSFIKLQKLKIYL